MMGMAIDPIWYAVVSPAVFVGPVLTLVFMVMLAAVYPAVKASRISPVEAMRHQ
jgi:ABC-type antimicrobial peptide transport system permease subunit